MSVARLPVPPGRKPDDARREPGRLSGVAPRPARVVTSGARRRFMVALAKRVLPLAAVALLALVALWPELSTDAERSRITYHVGDVAPEGGALTDARYRGVDAQGHPFSITASLARQIGPDRANLTDPQGDITLDGGSWLSMKAKHGVYLPHADQLDLSGDVTLYRDDGTVMTTAAATMDLKAGAATSADKVHVEGPFGTLDAQGFAVLDRGAVVQFTGPGRLVLNGGSK